MHIAITSLWVLPVIAAGTIPRLVFLLASAGLHLWLSARFYHEWAWSPPRVIDGGPLGFLTWTIPLLVGSLAYDAMVRADDRKLPIGKLVLGSGLLMLAGYAIASAGGRWASPPFVLPPEAGRSISGR